MDIRPALQALPFLRYAQARSGDRCEPESRHALKLLHGRRRVTALTVPPGCISWWIPVVGGLSLASGGGRVNLVPGRMLVWTEGALRASSTREGMWIALVGTPEAWCRLLRGAGEVGEGERLLYPGELDCPRELVRLAVRLLQRARPDRTGQGRAGHDRTGHDRAGQDRAGHDRAGRLPGDPACEGLLEALAALLVRAQDPVDALAERCHGRTLLRRRRNLLRLMQVRCRVEMDPGGCGDLAEMAGRAMYSRSHFVRVFREVFGETPFEFVARTRFRQARELVVSRSLSVTEIAQLVGYESRSAFCRSFRQAFGMTAGEARRRAAAQG